MSIRARWSLRNIYLYLVCLITLIMVIVALVGLVRNGVELAYPDPGGYWERPVAVDGEEADFDEEAFEEQRERQVESERRWTLIDLVGNAAMLLVAGPVYLYHWRKIETEPEESEHQTEGA